LRADVNQFNENPRIFFLNYQRNHIAKRLMTLFLGPDKLFYQLIGNNSKFQGDRGHFTENLVQS